MFPAIIWTFALGLVTVTASPIFNRQGSLQIVSNCKTQGQIALTFDDGPYIFERDIASALGGGKGTFFVNGMNYDCIYNHIDDIRYLDSQGHTIASHTWSHRDMTTLSYEEIHGELAKVEQALIRILGKRPLYFRPPFGSYNNQVLQVASERGYTKMILWTDDTGDSSGASLGAQEGVMEGVIQSFPIPKMILQHSTIETAPEVVSDSVPKLLERGYKFVTVDDCLGDGSPYEIVGQPGKSDGSWTC